MARFIRYLVLGGFLDKKKECWVLVVTVAATRGGSLNIAVQPWLKGNSTHKQEKKGIEKKRGVLHRTTKQQEQHTEANLKKKTTKKRE